MNLSPNSNEWARGVLVGGLLVGKGDKTEKLFRRIKESLPFLTNRQARLPIWSREDLWLPFLEKTQN